MWRLTERVRRGWLRLVLLAVTLCVSVWLALLLFQAGSDAVQELTGIAGMFTGLWALGVAIVQLLPAPAPPQNAGEVADELAASVQEQWTEEATARQLRDPRVIPLSWTATDRPVAADAEDVLGPRAGRVLRLSLNGRLEGDFHCAAAQLAEGYRNVPSGRLVVLGEPGAGKTVLALMLTLGLLTDRTPQAPVPVLLSVSSWDPVSESLDDWILSTLAAEYYGGQTHVPRLLLNQRMLLPVLDGLDEIPEAARRNAVRGLNETSGEGRGLVLTCRSAEYQDVIEGGSPALRRAPVVEVAPVSMPDAVSYLQEVNWPDGVDWDPVYTHLRAHPDAPAATALSTPLALSLARAVYRHCDRDPAELLDFDSPHAVEDHLVDHIIPAAYAPPPGRLPEQADGAWRQEARQAEKWLTFLATYLHRHRERDLAWWRMSNRLLSRWAGLLVGIGAGLTTTALVAIVGVRSTPANPLAPVCGAIVAVLAMLTWYAAPDRPPGRLSFALRGSLHRLYSGFRTGFALTSVLAVTLLGLVGVSLVAGKWRAGNVAQFFQMAAFATGAAIALGVAFAVYQWLDTPPEHSTRASPVGLLRQDRRLSLVGAGLAGTVFGATALPLLVMVVSTAFMVFLALTHWSGEPRMTDIMARVADDTDLLDSSEALLAATVLPGAVFAVLTLLHRAWPRFVLLHLFLAARGQLPWRFVGFLTDARGRQLLRQSGGTYQFRHIRLQERLAGRSLARDRVPTARGRTARRRRTQIAVTGVVVAGSCLLVSQVMPQDTSRMILPTGDVEAMAFGPPGTHSLVTVDDKGTVRRWNTQTGEKDTAGKANFPSRIAYEAGPSYAMAATKDAAVLIASREEEDGVVQWRLPWKGHPQLTKSGLPGRVASVPGDSVVGLSTGGRYLLTKGERGVVLRDMRTGNKSPFDLNEPALNRILAMNDNRRLIVSNNVRTTTLYDRTGDKRLCTLDEPGFVLGIDARGTQFATAGINSTTAYLWNTRCRKDGSITSHKNIDTLALDENGDELAATVDGMTRLYDVSALEE